MSRKKRKKRKTPREKKGLHHHPAVEPLLRVITDLQHHHNGLCEHTQLLALRVEALVQLLSDKELITLEEYLEAFQNVKEKYATGKTHEPSPPTDHPQLSDRTDEPVSDDGQSDGAAEAPSPGEEPAAG